MTSTLTRKAKEQITSDWQRLFPHLGVWKPMSLLRRNGPLLVGIWLDRTRSNDRYVPLFHVHNLIRPCANIVLGLCQGVAVDGRPGMRQEIRVVDHPASFASAADRLAKQVPLVAQRDVTFSDVLSLYRRFLEARVDPALARFPLALYSDEILLSAWAGDRTRAESCLRLASERMATWPEHEVQLESWRSRMLELMPRETQEASVKAEIARHGLASIPFYELHPDRVEEACLAALA